MRLGFFACTALLSLAACAPNVDAVCEEALQAFYDCGGAPQATDFDACVERYETSTLSCQNAFSDRLNCTYDLSCDAELSYCGDAFSIEDSLCGGDPIVPPY